MVARAYRIPVDPGRVSKISRVHINVGLYSTLACAHTQLALPHLVREARFIGGAYSLLGCHLHRKDDCECYTLSPRILVSAVLAQPICSGFPLPQHIEHKAQSW